MLIHCIHDPERVDRRVLLQSEIIGHNLEVQFWPAIKDPQMSFRGIARAHKQIVRWAKEQQLPMVCIAEDDFHITGPGCWEFFLQKMPADFDIYLSGIYYGQLKPDNTTSDFCALHLYIVHERFYDTFLGIREEQNLDRGLTGKGKFVVCNPFAAIQYDGYSDNKKRFASYGHHLQGRQLCCA